MVWSTCSLQIWKDYVYFIWPSASRLQVSSGTPLFDISGSLAIGVDCIFLHVMSFYALGTNTWHIGSFWLVVYIYLNS